MNNNGVGNDVFGIQFDVLNIANENPNNDTPNADPILNGPFGTATGSIIRNGTTETLNPSDNPNVHGVIYRSGFSNTGTTGAFVSRSTYGSGRVVAAGDSSAIDDGTCQSGNKCFNGWNDPGGQNNILFPNGTEWLASGNSSTGTPTPTPNPSPTPTPNPSPTPTPNPSPTPTPNPSPHLHLILPPHLHLILPPHLHLILPPHLHLILPPHLHLILPPHLHLILPPHLIRAILSPMVDSRMVLHHGLKALAVVLKLLAPQTHIQALPVPTSVAITIVPIVSISRSAFLRGFRPQG